MELGPPINCPHMKNLLQTEKQFKQALKEFLHFHSFYSLKEFYNSTEFKTFNYSLYWRCSVSIKCCSDNLNIQLLQSIYILYIQTAILCNSSLNISNFISFDQNMYLIT
jgi:hypothetical protein